MSTKKSRTLELQVSQSSDAVKRLFTGINKLLPLEFLQQYYLNFINIIISSTVNTEFSVSDYNGMSFLPQKTEMTDNLQNTPLGNFRADIVIKQLWV